MGKLKRLLEAEELRDLTLVSFLVDKIDPAQGYAIIEEIEALMEGRRSHNMVLDCSRLTFMSSAGMSSLLYWHDEAKQHGGRLVLCNLGGIARPLFSLLALDRYLTIYPSLEEAIESLRGSLRDAFQVCCPVRDCKGQAEVRGALAGQTVTVRCPECRAESRFVLPEVAPDTSTTTPVDSIAVETYPAPGVTGKAEAVELNGAWPVTLRIIGRLDLFISAEVERLWRSVNPPRRILVDCTQTTEASDRGVEVLERLVREEATKLPVLVGEKTPSSLKEAVGFTSFTELELAVQALGDLTEDQRPRILATVNRVISPEPETAK
jgi:anti-sigma B factor antagonist